MADFDRTSRHWWQRTLQAKFSLRLVLASVALGLGPVVTDYDGWGLVGKFVLLQVATFTAEGLAALWPSVFGRRAGLRRRMREAWRNFNRVHIIDGPSND